MCASGQYKNPIRIIETCSRNSADRLKTAYASGIIAPSVFLSFSPLRRIDHAVKTRNRHRGDRNPFAESTSPFLRLRANPLASPLVYSCPQQLPRRRRRRRRLCVESGRNRELLRNFPKLRNPRGLMAAKPPPLLVVVSGRREQVEGYRGAIAPTRGERPLIKQNHKLDPAGNVCVCARAQQLH